jgi:hypothetical protein
MVFNLGFSILCVSWLTFDFSCDYTVLLLSRWCWWWSQGPGCLIIGMCQSLWLLLVGVLTWCMWAILRYQDIDSNITFMWFFTFEHDFDLA